MALEMTVKKDIVEGIFIPPAVQLCRTYVGRYLVIPLAGATLPVTLTPYLIQHLSTYQVTNFIHNFWQS
jgi:hypothetical protein